MLGVARVEAATHARTVIEDDIARAGIEEPEPPRLARRVGTEPAKQRIVEVILGATQLIASQFEVKRKG